MKQSEPFTAMAERIERNPEFGGAVVIVPPGGEEAMQWLIVDDKADVIRFWLKLKTDIESVIQVLDERARTQQAFRVR